MQGNSDSRNKATKFQRLKKHRWWLLNKKYPRRLRVFGWMLTGYAVWVLAGSLAAQIILGGIPTALQPSWGANMIVVVILVWVVLLWQRGATKQISSLEISKSGM